MAKETEPKVILSKEERSALVALGSADREATASMSNRNAEAQANILQVREFRKGLKYKPIKDPVKLRELRRGKRE